MYLEGYHCLDYISWAEAEDMICPFYQESFFKLTNYHCHGVNKNQKNLDSRRGRIIDPIRKILRLILSALNQIRAGVVSRPSGVGLVKESDTDSR